MGTVQPSSMRDHTVTQLETGHVQVQKKRDWKVFQSYDLHVQFGDKLVTVKMNTFKFPWNKEIKGSNFTKDLLKKLEIPITDTNKVDSLMRVWTKSALEIEKRISTAKPGEQKNLNKLRHDADISVRAMQQFFNTYPKRGHLRSLDPAQFEIFRLDTKPDPILSIKKDMALLYHELMNPESRKEVVDKLSEKLVNHFGNITAESEQRGEVLQKLERINEAMVNREEASGKLRDIENELRVMGHTEEGNLITQKDYNRIVDYMESISEDLEEMEILSETLKTSADLAIGVLANKMESEGILQGEDLERFLGSHLDLEHFIDLSSRLATKLEGHVEEYEKLQQDYNEKKTKKRYKAAEADANRMNQLKMERGEKIEQLERKLEEALPTDGILQEYRETLNKSPEFSKSRQSYDDYQKEIDAMDFALDQLEVKLNKLEDSMDQLAGTPERDTTRSLEIIMTGILEDKPGLGWKEQLRDLSKDVKYLVKHGYERAAMAAEAKLLEVKKKTHSDFPKLREDLDKLENQVRFLEQKKEKLEEEQQHVKSQIDVMVNDLYDAPKKVYDAGVAKAEEEYEKGKEDSLHKAQEEFHDDEFKKIVENEMKYAKSYTRFVKAHEVVKGFRDKMMRIRKEKDGLKLSIINSSKTVESYFDLDLGRWADPSEDPHLSGNLLPLQIVTMCMIAALQPARSEKEE